MDKTKIFPFKVKTGAYRQMASMLRFPETTGPEIDNAVCRVTYSNYAVDLTLKTDYIANYTNENVCQVRLLNNNEREFIVMSGM